MSKAPAPAPDGDAPPKKSKKLLFIIIGLVVVLIAGAAAAFFLLAGHGDEEDEEDAPVKEKAKAKKKDEGKMPIFLPLDPPFTVNLIQDQGEQFLQISVSLRVTDPAADPLIKALMPQIRNNVLRTLSSKKAADLYTVEGKDLLADELKREINTIIEPPKKGAEPDGPVHAVLFTSFIIQ